MANRKVSEIERLFSPCSAIGFLVSDDHAKQLPKIILGFDDEVSGSVAYHALRNWAKDDDLIAALLNKEDYIDVTFVHTESYETATVSQLSFREKDYSDFIKSEPQGRRLAINHCINPINNGTLIQVLDPSPLVLVRYILIIPDSSHG